MQNLAWNRFLCENLDATRKLAASLFLTMKKEGKNILLLKGNLGSGKTTFCQEILRISGAKGPFTSPTFVIIKKYDLKENKFFRSAYHIDCYRIGEKDILELGWKEIIADKKNLVLVEWPEKIQTIWPEQFMKIDLKILNEKGREIIREK